MLTEEIKVNDTLNPDLWENDELKEDVKEKLLDIVDAFLDAIKEDNIDVNVVDARFLGSNASYNYTDKSDIDLHIVVNLDGVPEKDIMSLLLSAYKTIFNSKFDITIKGHEVEIYVEDENSPAKSNGVYSLYTGWIKKPERQSIPEIDYEAIDNGLDTFEDRYFNILNSLGIDNSIFECYNLNEGDNMREKLHYDLTENADIDAIMDTMATNNQYQDDAYIGPFWYDPNKKELYGYVLTLANDVPYHDFKGKKYRTGNALHKNIWKKETFRGKDKRFQGDYKLKPRGRVFEEENGGFKVFVGSWIDNYPEAKDEIIDIFQLPKDNTEFIKDTHWDIGHGWSEELYLG